METEEQLERRAPKMDDVGTRYDHLLEYKESLEICIEIIKRNPRGNPQALSKFMVAAEILNTTIDAFSGYNDTTTEFTMYKLLNSVPKTIEQAEALESKRGTPLE